MCFVECKRSDGSDEGEGCTDSNKKQKPSATAGETGQLSGQ